MLDVHGYSRARGLLFGGEVNGVKLGITAGRGGADGCVDSGGDMLMQRGRKRMKFFCCSADALRMRLGWERLGETAAVICTRRRERGRTTWLQRNQSGKRNEAAWFCMRLAIEGLLGAAGEVRQRLVLMGL